MPTSFLVSNETDLKSAIARPDLGEASLAPAAPRLIGWVLANRYRCDSKLTGIRGRYGFQFTVPHNVARNDAQISIVFDRLQLAFNCKTNASNYQERDGDFR